MTLLGYQLRREIAADCAAVPAAALITRVESRATDANYQLRADLPGVQPQDIEITAEDGVLTIKATRKSWLSGDGETPAVTYRRQFALPEDANTDAIEARSSHGVLEVEVARQPKVQPRRIQVQAA